MSNKLNLSSGVALFALVALLVISAGCNRGSSHSGATNSSGGDKRYSFKGKVVSLDKLAGAANIDNEPIAGYMDQMTMAYPVKPPAMFDQLQPGDSITADLIVQPDNKYWLESVTITGHSQVSADKPAAGEKNEDRNRSAQ